MAKVSNTAARTSQPHTIFNIILSLLTMMIQCISVVVIKIVSISPDDDEDTVDIGHWQHNTKN